MLELQGYKVSLTEVVEQDLELLRTWRNDSKISQYMLSQQKISEQQQFDWYEKIKTSSEQQHFMIHYKGQKIGSANIRLLIGERLEQACTLEPGLYIYDDRYRGNILAFAPTLLLNDYCFYTLNVKTLKAVIKRDNRAAINYNLKLGYKVIREAELVEIVLSQEAYEKSSASLKALLNR